MTDQRFVDSNVFVYTVDSRDVRKQEIARTLVADLQSAHALVLSSQVLLEFFHAATRKVGYPLMDALAAIEAFAVSDVVPATAELVRSAAEISILEQQSVWDSMILAAALQRRCPVLYSEDFGTGRRIRGIEIRNPFA